MTWEIAIEIVKAVAIWGLFAYWLLRYKAEPARCWRLHQDESKWSKVCPCCQQCPVCHGRRPNCDWQASTCEARQDEEHPE